MLLDTVSVILDEGPRLVVHNRPAIIGNRMIVASFAFFKLELSTNDCFIDIIPIDIDVIISVGKEH